MIDLEKITSRDNQRLVNVRKVRDGKDTGRIFIEGRRLVDEALRSTVVTEECFCVEDFGDRELLSLISKRTKNIVEISPKIFHSIADTDNSQGIILLAERPADGTAVIDERLTSKKSPLPIVLFLNEINNPSNLGAILRTAEAAGVAGIVISENSADVYSPKALRAAMGASFRLPIWDHAVFDEVLLWSKNRGLQSMAADVRAEKSYTQINWRRPRLVIFGSEANGLADRDLARIDEQMQIPMENDVDSLNLAVSAGIILFEAKRQFAADHI